MLTATAPCSANLHGRGESRFYAKPLKAWQSPYPLSDEEQQGPRSGTGHARCGARPPERRGMMAGAGPRFGSVAAGEP
jgi:hypothetical protein